MLVGEVIMTVVYVRLRRDARKKKVIQLIDYITHI